MRQFLYCEAGYVEKDQWLPNSWVNVECPTPEDLQFLMDRFNVPESFLSDIADTDERPRIEYEGNWLLTILRIPLQNQDHDIPFNTVPIGIITNNEIIVSVCYHKTDLIPDFIRYTQRKELQIKNKYELILRLIHSSAVWFLKYLKQINYAVTEAEKALEKSIRNEDLLALMKLENSMVFSCSRSCYPLRPFLYSGRSNGFRISKNKPDADHPCLSVSSASGKYQIRYIFI